MSGKRADESQKKGKGQSIIELAVGLIAVIPIVLFVFDLAIIIIAVQINDSTCREAARVAASGDPKDALARAQAVLARANAHPIGMVSNFRLGPAPAGLGTNPNLITSNGTAVLTQETNLQSYGGALQGSVNVQTQVDVKPFVVAHFYSGTGVMTFQSSQTFPITYVVPNTTN